MLAEDLIALAGARSLDLSKVGGSESETHKLAAKRRRTAREIRLGIEIVETAQGRDSRSVRRPYWSIAELGTAASRTRPGKRVDIEAHDIPFLTVLFQIAGDTSGDTYWTLYRALRYHAMKIADRERWRPLVPGRTPRDPRTRKPIVGVLGEPHSYLEDLARLVLDEDRHRPLFKAIPGLHAAYMNVEDETWSRVLEPRFHSVRAQFERWAGMGRARVRNWLLEPEVDGDGQNAA
jgi:hypothetical protein